MIIVDWDGTATTEDTLIEAMKVFGDWDVYLEASAALHIASSLVDRCELVQTLEKGRSPLIPMSASLRNEPP